jgi:hypothetical protein
VVIFSLEPGGWWYRTLLNPVPARCFDVTTFWCNGMRRLKCPTSLTSIEHAMDVAAAAAAAVVAAAAASDVRPLAVLLLADLAH